MSRMRKNSLLMQSFKLSQERAEEVVTVEVDQDDHQSISVELIEEQRAEEVITVDHEIQDGHQSIPLSSELISVSDRQWIKGMTKSLNERRAKTQGRWPCSIFKVPEDLRQCDATAYDPFIVTIGPYHYNKSEDRTVRAMQDHKWHCVRRLLSRHTKSRRKATDLWGECLMAMKEMDADVRGCYSEDLHHLSPHDLALIMLLDGCFIIHVLLNLTEANCFDDISNMVKLGKNNDHEDGQQEDDDIVAEHEADHMVVLDVMGERQIDLRVVAPIRGWIRMLYDLVKVENQIPFPIIQTLFSKLKTPGDEDINLVKTALLLLSIIHPSDLESSTAIVPDLPVHHLLHLFHSTLIPSGDCLDINKTNLTKYKNYSEIEWIPNATELQLAGVKFVQKKGSDISFLDISFKSDTIEIPQIMVDDNTNTLFRNLVAFEQCYHPHTKDYVTSYVFFMDYMINTPKDVELFELKGIFINQLGAPDHAAALINHLSRQICDHRNSYLQGSIQGVKIYYESKWHKWRARLMRDYFDNPWAVVSLVAALILLLLTVEQSFFSAYSYFRPPN